MTRPDSFVGALQTLFAELFHIERPPADADLLEAGLLDSFQLVELIAGIERRFGVHLDIDQFELDDLRSLARIARLLDRLTSPADARATPSPPSASG